MPDYADERRSRDYYNRRARIYDWSNKLASLLRGVSGTRERHKAVRRLNLQPGSRVIEVSVGTGTNLPLIARKLDKGGRMVGLDISPGMLDVCERKLTSRGLTAELVVGEAAHLPFADGSFDAVFHHGGIAEFGDRGAAIAEMNRIARPGAKVVVCDVGVPTDRRLSPVNRLLLRFQPEYAKPPPMDVLPADAMDVKLSWFHGGGWYVIEFSKAS